LAHERAGTAPKPRSVFSEPDFLRLWTVGVSTFTVRWLETLAISVFVYHRTASEFAVALMMMWRVLPMALFGAFLGAWSDVIDRRRALLAILIASLATSLSIAALAFLEALEIWHLGVASFMNGIAWACDNPVRRTLLGQAVGPSRLGSAMAADVGSNNASRALGPSLGGVLMVATGIYGAFLGGALLYLVGVAAALGLSLRSNNQYGPATPVLTQLLNGWREIGRNDRFRGLLLITILFNVFGWPTVSLIPVISESVLGRGLIQVHAITQPASATAAR
jgi:MFS family permease